MRSQPLLPTLLFLSAAIVPVTSAKAGWDYDHIEALVPLYHLANDAITDNFYTISQVTRDGAIACCGYRYVDIAAWVTPSTSYPEAGGLASFLRTWKGAPQLEHFYTTTPSDIPILQGMGYSSEGSEGALHTASGTGLNPVFRLNKFNPATSDLVHHYTINSTEKNMLVSEGWHVDGTIGYAYAAPAFTSAYHADIRINGGGLVYITVPNFAEPGSTVGDCAGHVEYTIKPDSQVSTIHSGVATEFTWGPVPSAFGVSEQGCSVNTQIFLQAGKTYSATLRYGGARARRMLSNSWTIYQPSTWYTSRIWNP